MTNKLDILFPAQRRLRPEFLQEREYAFNQSCVASYNQYQKTGLHVTHEELVPWMESLFTDNELPPPECHA